jgi:hypothetical protein
LLDSFTHASRLSCSVVSRELKGQQAQGLPRSLVFATDSGDNDREEIEEFVKSVKRRAQEDSRIGGSSAQDRRPELWTLPVPVLALLNVLGSSFFSKNDEPLR